MVSREPLLPRGTPVDSVSDVNAHVASGDAAAAEDDQTGESTEGRWPYKCGGIGIFVF